MAQQPIVAPPRGPNVPYFPVTLGDDTPSPLQFTDNPTETDWASPSSTGYDGPPDDSFPGLANNPNIPGPWNRTTQQQDPGVAYNHNDDNTVMNNGTGYLGWITDWQGENMGGLFGDVPLDGFGSPEVWPDVRYQGSPLTQDEGSDQYIVWAEPLEGTTTPNPLLTKFVPFLG